MITSRSLLVAAALLASSVASSAYAGKFSKFKGSYDGTAKVSGTGLSYSSSALTTVKTPSNGQQAKFKLTSESGSDSFYLQLKLNKSGGCKFVFEFGNFTINADGTYTRISNKKVKFEVSTVLGGVDVTATGTAQLPNNQTLKISGSVNTGGSIPGVPPSLSYSFKGKDGS